MLVDAAATASGLYDRIGDGIRKTRRLIASSRDDIVRVRRRTESIRAFFERRFCIGLSYPPDRHCGSDADFAVALEAITRDFHDIRCVVKNIETAGLMVQSVQEGIECESRDDAEATLRAYLERTHPNKPALNSRKVNDTRQGCLLNKWPEGKSLNSLLAEKQKKI